MTIFKIHLISYFFRYFSGHAPEGYNDPLLRYERIALELILDQIGGNRRQAAEVYKY